MHVFEKQRYAPLICPALQKETFEKSSCFGTGVQCGSQILMKLGCGEFISHTETGKYNEDNRR